uniref:Uncharacterized protein n=1 Tax=Leersia perrieri TaxID=77586 RepID=A0A0D9XJU1_9ORYZ
MFHNPNLYQEFKMQKKQANSIVIDDVLESNQLCHTKTPRQLSEFCFPIKRTERTISEF